MKEMWFNSIFLFPLNLEPITSVSDFEGAKKGYEQNKTHISFNPQLQIGRRK